MTSTQQSPSPWLRLARWVLLALVAASMLAVLASLILAPAYLSSHLEDYQPNEHWSPEGLQAALAELGWPAATVAWMEYMRSVCLYLGFLAAGLIILARKGNDWFGLYLGFAFAFLPALGTIDPLIPLLPSLEGLRAAAGSTGWQFVFITFFVFPDGQFVPRWTRWLLPLWVGLNVISAGYGGQRAAPAWVGPAFVLLVFIACGSQIYRYFRRSNVVQRQQTKWVVAVLAFLPFLVVGGFSLLDTQAVTQTLGQALQLELARLVVLTLSFILIPIAIAIAILRYRLWDIDVIIRRTLIYSVLSAVLALAYFGSVLTLESIFRALTGQGQNALVVVLSTLAIAALFGPVRGRVQATIDRRFFRKKYDAARTLAGFAAGARDETDLGQLSAQLIQVVDETMQPANVRLWLRPDSRQQSGRGLP